MAETAEPYVYELLDSGIREGLEQTRAGYQETVDKMAPVRRIDDELAIEVAGKRYQYAAFHSQACRELTALDAEMSTANSVLEFVAVEANTRRDTYMKNRWYFRPNVVTGLMTAGVGAAVLYGSARFGINTGWPAALVRYLGVGLGTTGAVNTVFMLDKRESATLENLETIGDLQTTVDALKAEEADLLDGHKKFKRAFLAGRIAGIIVAIETIDDLF